MSEFDELCAEVASRPGAEARIRDDVARMSRVLELEKLRDRR